MTAPVVVLVCGGRDFTDRARVDWALDTFMRHNNKTPADMAILEGGARGADTLAREWAKRAGCCVLTVPAPWDFYQLAAGRVRNGWMLTFGRPSFCVAFPGGRGTANMREQCAAVGVNVWVPFP